MHAHNTERLAFEERPTDELMEEYKTLQESITKCVTAVMRDGRPNVSETPIVAQEEKYRENYREVMNELIDRGEI